MPELPEVETIKKDLEKKIISKKIIGVEIFQNKSVKNSADKFIESLKNNSVKDIKKKGKLLALELEKGNNYLLIHLRMTGQLIYSNSDINNKHTGIIIYFENKSKLYFNDIRRFGYLKIVSEKEKNDALRKMGIDLLDKNFNLEELKKIFKNKKRTLKSFLLDQKIMAGIGNIYADEICFGAKLNPARKTETLTNEEIQRLYNSIGNIINLAIKHRGTSFSDYVDAGGKKGSFIKLLKVYKKENEECGRCHGKSIKKIKLAGRSTRYCHRCQK